MATPLNMDEFEVVSSAPAPAAPLNMDEFEEVPAAAEPEQPKPSLWERAKGFVKSAGDAIAEAPGKAAADPIGTALATASGVAGGATLGYFGPEAAYARARENYGNTRLAFKSGAASSDAMRAAERELGEAKRILDAANEQKAARFTGEIIGGGRGAGAAVTKNIMAAVPAAGALAKTVRAGVGAAAGGAVEGAGRTLAEGGTAQEAIEAGQTGALFAGALGAGGQAVPGVLRRVKGSATENVEDRILDGLSLGAKARSRDKLAAGTARGAGGSSVRDAIEVRHKDIMDVVEATPGLKEAALAKDSARAQEIVSTAKVAAGESIGEQYARIDSVALGAPKKDLVEAIKRIASSYDRPGQKPVANGIRKFADEVAEEFADQRFIPLREANRLKGTLQDLGYDGNLVSPKLRQQANRDAASAVREVIDKRFDEIADLSGEIAKRPGLRNSQALQDLADIGDAGKKIRELNKRYSLLSDIETPLVEKARREGTPATTARAGLGRLFKGATDVGSGVAAAATGSVLPLAIPLMARAVPKIRDKAAEAIAGPVGRAAEGGGGRVSALLERATPAAAVQAGRGVGRREAPSDAAVARLIQRARSGASPAEIRKQAAEWGVPGEMADRVIAAVQARR